MFAFPFRQRRLVFVPADKTPVFPAQAECVFEFSPEDIFGGRNRGTPLALRGETCTIYWDANKGQSRVDTWRHIKTIRLDCLLGGYDIRLTGGDFNISFSCTSLEHLRESLTLFSHLPLYFGLFLGHPVMIDAVHGTVGDCSFNCELVSGQFTFNVVTEEGQMELLRLALEAALESRGLGNPRLLAALGYLYTASLLHAQSPYSSAFLPEVALNLCKTLDVLFTDNRDGLRDDLRKLGFTAEEIETRYVGLTLLRNQLDVAHPTLGIPTEEERRIFDSFVSGALSHVREVLKRVVEQSIKGEYEIRPYDANKHRIDKENLLKKLSQYQHPSEQSR